MEQEQKQEINNENYFSTEMKKKYMSVSLYKDFKKCEVMALAKATGEYEEKPTDALLTGSYVDAYFSGELEDFLNKHPEMFSKQGTLLAKYKIADEVIKTIEEDKELMKYLNGQKQVVMTGTINNVPFKIKMDAYHPNKLIVDQKIMKDMDQVWIEYVDEDTGEKYNKKVDFVEAYGYVTQGAVYQFIESQNSESHKKLPFVLAVTTKEEYPDKALIQIDQEYLDSEIEEVKEKAPRYWDILNGKIEPQGCGHCPVCRSKKQLTGVMSYKRLFKKGE